VIQDIEDLRAELNIEAFRNSSDRGVLDCGEIQVYKFRTDDGIAAGIAEKIGASAGNARHESNWSAR
jgi:hypothetical protein